MTSSESSGPDQAATTKQVQVRGSKAPALPGGPVESSHLCEDTLGAGDCLVTLSTFYDGVSRSIRSVLVAHTDGSEEERLVITSFELERVDGSPNAEETKSMHLRNANLVAHLLAGEPTDEVEHGDLIRAVVESASFFAAEFADGAVPLAEVTS